MEERRNSAHSAVVRLKRIVVVATGRGFWAVTGWIRSTNPPSEGPALVSEAQEEDILIIGEDESKGTKVADIYLSILELQGASENGPAALRIGGGGMDILWN